MQCMVYYIVGLALNSELQGEGQRAKDGNFKTTERSKLLSARNCATVDKSEETSLETAQLSTNPKKQTVFTERSKLRNCRKIQRNCVRDCATVDDSGNKLRCVFVPAQLMFPSKSWHCFKLCFRSDRAQFRLTLFSFGVIALLRTVLCTTSQAP